MKTKPLGYLKTKEGENRKDEEKRKYVYGEKRKYIGKKGIRGKKRVKIFSG